MNVSLKKGSTLSVPLFAGWSVTSDSPQTVLAKMQGASVTLTAVNLGSGHLTLHPTSYVSLTLTVTVTA